MPELPEVETVRRALKKLVLGKTIASVTITHEKLIQPATPEAFAQQLTGQTLRDVQRRGKYLILIFDRVSLLSHLRMEGKYSLKNGAYQKDKHDHAFFTFTDGCVLVYQDVRKFGTMQVKSDKDLYTTPPLSKLGPEPSDVTLTVETLKHTLRSNRAIKTVLLDQRVIAGLGNIYVDEVLFCAKINPSTQSQTLNDSQIIKLIDCARRIIDKAIALGGSSVRTYKDSLTNMSGRFQNELNVHLRVDQPCFTCHRPIVKTKVNQRGTYYCPHCQK